MKRTVALLCSAASLGAAWSCSTGAPTAGSEVAPAPGAPASVAPNDAGNAPVAPDDAGNPSTRRTLPLEEAEAALLFGDDRVGRTLRSAWESLPSDLAGVESLFGLGRTCDRELSHEIFVVEEARTRLKGQLSDLEQVSPRVVITGCSDDARERAEFFAVAVTDPARALSDDPLATSPMELMAFDSKAGAYSFYELLMLDDGPAVRRIVRTTDGVELRERPVHSPLRREVSGARCFGCHVNGAPLMNELSTPWPGWLSEVSPTVRRHYGGVTRALVDDATNSARRAIAYDLERTIEVGMDLSVYGAPEEPGTGYVARTLAAGDIRALLKSVFCWTELNWHPNPAGLFVEPELFQGDTVAVPTVPSALAAPRLLPQRSSFDRRVSTALVGRGILSARLLTAIRLLDEASDLSESRCGAHADLDAAALSSSVASARAEISRIVRARVEAWSDSPRRAYGLLLLDESASDGEISSARTTFMTNLRPRISSVSEGELAVRIQTRMHLAEVLFPGPIHPRPRL